jgi:hypothetical protein
MDFNQIMQTITAGGILAILVALVKMSVEIGGFREWRKNVDFQLNEGRARMGRHSDKLDTHPPDECPTPPARNRARSQGHLKRLK